MPVLDQLKDNLSQTHLLNDKSLGATALLKLIQANLGTAELAFPNPVISGISSSTPDIPAYQDSRSFSLTDQLALFPYGAKTGAAIFSVNIIFLESGSEIEMNMLLQPLKTDWQLTQSFPSLEYSFFNRLVFSKSGAPQMTLSSIAYTDKASETIEVGLNFAATLALDGVLKVVLDIISGQTDGIRIMGLIRQEKGAAALSLKGALASVSPTIPGLDQIVQFNQAAFYLLATPAGENKSSCSVEIQGDIQLGKDKPLTLPVAIGVPTGLFGWSLRLRHVPDQPDLRLTDIMGLFLSDQEIKSLPKELNTLKKTSLSQLYIGFDPKGNGPSIFDIAILVPGPWEAVKDYFGLKDMLFALHVQSDKTGKSWYGGIRGILEIGIDVPLALQIVPGGTWSFTISPDEGDTKPSLSDLVKVMGGNDLLDHLPPGISGSKILELDYASIKFNPTDKDNKIKQIDLKVDVVKNMDILPGFLKIQDVRADISISDPLDSTKRALSGVLSGDFLIGDTALFLEATLPDQTIKASAPDLKLTELIEKFLPDSAVVFDHLPDLDFKDILIELNARDRSYSISGSTAGVWQIIGDDLEMSNISLDLKHFGGQDNYTSFKLSGDVIIEGISFYVSAAHQGKDAGWQFAGWLDGDPIHLTDLLEKMMKIDPPAILPKVDIDVLSLSYDTASGALSFEEETEVTWNKTVAGMPINKLDIKVKIDSEVDRSEMKPVTPTNGLNTGNEAAGTRIYKGYFEGDLLFKNDLALILRYDFAPKNKSLQLSYDNYICTVSYQEDTKTTTFKLQMGYFKLGDLIAYAVNKVAPELHFKLEAPWNILNDIDLHNLILELVIVNDKKTATVEYQVNKKFAFVEVGTIGLSFPIGGTEQDKKVDFQISGNFAGMSYPAAQPLKWDLLNEKPPVPGNGTSQFDLRYLALGQHIALRDAAQYDSIEKILAALETNAQAVKPEDGNILSQLKGLKYRADSNWFIGADLSVLDAISLGMIFNDPELYGMVISLKGPKVKIFDGLKFEILYKKINDEIGEYYAELKLPDAMRHLEFGAVSITLPVVAVSIYTNGNFLIDFGFPWNNNFSRSLGIQLFPFVGAGGFYFGVLNGATSKQVPAISNGTWAPVIVFGLGLKVGVGKEIDEGIFTASLSLVVQGIVEGALAVFNPTNPALPHEHYFKMQGAINIVGQLQGAVNFAILKAQVSVKVYADARIVIESHQPIHFGVDAGVEVSLTVEVLLINIHLSFKAHISQNFTIGEASPTPWQLAPSNGQAPLEADNGNLRERFSPMAFAEKKARRRTALEVHEMVSADFGAAQAGFSSFTLPSLAATDTLDWTGGAASPYPSTPDDLSLLFVPAYTILDPGADTPNKIAFIAELFIENGIDDTAEKPFDQLIKTLFAWSLKSYTPAALGDLNESNSATKTISYDALDKLYKALCSEALPGHTDIIQFLNTNFKDLKITSGDSLSEKTNATVFPMPPEISMTAGTLTVNFGEYGKDCDTAYIQMLATYFNQLQMGGDESLNEASFVGKESFATLLFNDYFGLLVKAIVQGAQKLLQAYAYTVTSGEIKAQLQQYGISFEPVEGHSYSPSFQQLVYANKNIALATDTMLALKDIHYPIKTNACNLQSIAGGFVEAAKQSDFIQQILEKNLFESSFLQTAATIKLDELTYTLPDNHHYAIQTRFGVGTEDVKLSNRIEDNTIPTLDQQYSYGAQVEVSNVKFSVENTAQQTLNTLNKIAYAYGLHPGDIVLASQQDYPSIANLAYDAVLPIGQKLILPTIQYIVPPFEKEMIAIHFGVALDQLTLPSNYVPGSTVTIKQITYNLLPGDSFASIGRFFQVGLDQLNQIVQTQNVLAAGRGIAMPDFSYAVKEKDTPATISAQFGMDQETLVWNNLAAIFPVGASITIPKARVPVADLMKQIIQDEQYGAKNLAGMCSRFLLHGLRLPMPDQVTETQGLYVLTGQQFDYDYANLLDKISLNKAGATLKLSLGAGGEELDFSLSNFNNTVLPGLKNASASLPNQILPYAAYEEVVHKFTLQQSIPWQCAQEPTYVGNPASAGDSRNPFLWLFPENLQSTLKTKQGLNLSLYKGSRDQGGQQGMSSQNVENYRWASLVSLKLKKAATNTADNALTHCYQLAGTKTESDRHLLTEILAASSKANAADLELYLLYAPNPTNDISGGLRSDLLYPATDTDGFDKVKIIKTNLATLTPPKSGSQVQETPLFNVATENYTPQGVGNGDSPNGPDSKKDNKNIVKNAWQIPLADGADGADWKGGNSLADLFKKTPKQNIQIRFNVCADDDNQEIIIGLGEAAYCFQSRTIGTAWKQITLNLSELTALPEDFYTSLTIPFCCRGKGNGGNEYYAYIEVDSIEYVAITKKEVIDLYGQASINEPQKFLQLAWEASIVHTEGYYLQYQNAHDQGLPSNLFSREPEAILSMLILGPITAGSETTIPDYYNCVLIKDSINPATQVLYAEDPTVKDWVQTLKPGYIGFELSRPEPDPSAFIPLHYNLLSYQVQGNSIFKESIEALPLGPRKLTPTDVDWHYTQLIPVFQLSQNEGLAVLDNPGLPSSNDNPYLGLGETLQIKYNWQDLFGNQAQKQSFIDNPTLLYRDPILPITQWPGTVSDYNISGTSGNVQLNFYVHFDVSKYLPDLNKTRYSCLKRAESDLLQYQSIYFQLHQADVQFGLYSSLDGGDQAHALAQNTLTPYTDAAYLFIGLLSKNLKGVTNGILPCSNKITGAVNQFKSISNTYHVSLGALANANKTLDAIFPKGASINKPDYYTVLFNDSLTTIDKGNETALALLNADREKVLTVGIELTLTINSAPVVYTVRPGDTLSSIATTNSIKVEQLADWNKGLPNLFQPGVQLLKNVTKEAIPAFPPGTAVSLENIAQEWNSSVEGLAFANAETDLSPNTALAIPGMYSFAPDEADKAHPFVYQVDANGSLKAIAASKNCSAADLFYANLDFQGILNPKSVVALPNIKGIQYTPDAYDTLRSVYHYFERQIDNLTKEAFIQALTDSGTNIFAASVYILLPPVSLALSTPLVPKYKKEVFPITASFEIKRTAHIDADWATKVPAITSVLTPLTARMEASSKGSLSLDSFADNLEKALGSAIKVATRNNSIASKSAEVQNLWAVPIVEKTSKTGNLDAITYEIQSDQARFYAPVPLANKLLSRKKVAVQAYTSGTGLAKEPEIRNFSGVDLDQWGQQFLAAVDHYLSFCYAIPAADLDEQAYNQLIQAKRTLADAISASIGPILIEDVATTTREQLSAAKAAMELRLLDNLSSAYAVDAIVQFDTTVNNSDYQKTDEVPSLFGKPMLTKDTPDAQHAISLSTASIPLGKEESFLTFLVEKGQKEGDLQAQDNPENIDLKFQYKVNGLEIGRGKADAEGYQDYDWFSFVLPFNDGTPVIKTEVPIPLRHYPIAPALIAQQGLSAASGDPANISIEEATKWDYEIMYEQYEESQDEIDLCFSFNVSDKMLAQQTQVEDENGKDDSSFSSGDLFTSLANFIYIWPQLEEDLELLSTLNRSNQNEAGLEKTAALAFQTFADTALQVANNWLQWNEVVNKAPQNDETEYKCVLKDFAEADGNLKISIRSLNDHIPLNTIPAVQVSSFTALVSPEKTHIPLNTIPAVQVPGQGGYYVPSDPPALQLLNLKTGKIESTIPTSDDFKFVSAVYADFKVSGNPNPLKFTDAGNIHQRQVLFSQLSILKIQNAWAGVAISRNRDLIEGKTTNPAFVYQTPWARFPNYLTPSIRVDNTIYISEIDSPGKPVARSLEQHLSLLFRRMLDLHPEPSAAQGPHQLKLACKYGFTLVQNANTGDSITTAVPVLLQPEFTFEVYDWMITGDDSTRATFVQRLSKAIQEWQQANYPNLEGGAYIFELTLLTGSEDAERLLNFLVNNHSSNLPYAMSRTRMPLSYYIEKDYWTTAPNNQDNPALKDNPTDLFTFPAYVERMLATYGADIYDVATMQIALSIYPDFQAGTQLAREWTQRLLSSRSGILQKDGGIRGFYTDTGKFEYGDKLIQYPIGENDSPAIPGPYFFRMISDQFAFIDPLTGESTIEVPNTKKEKPTDPDTIEGILSWTDWKPITGENAWAAMIGPLQLEYSRSKDKIQYNSEGVQLALYILPALVAMQAKNGGIYYAPTNTAGNQGGNADPKSISNENNFSTYGGITMLMEVLALCYKNESDATTCTAIETAFNSAQTVAIGILDYFQGKTQAGGYNLLNQKTAGEISIYTGGTYKNGPFEPGVEGFKAFAVDVHTWGCSVLGIQNIEKWFGTGTVYELWQNVKNKAGYFEDGNTKGNILGVGYTDVDTDPSIPNGVKHEFIISAEWSFGAITMCRVIGQQYLQKARLATNEPDKEKYYAYAAELLKDADTMTHGVRSLLLDTSRASRDIYAYYYANRRYYIPFGWFANRADSLCSTAWALMVMNNYNPFVLGGSYEKKVIDPNTFSLTATLNASSSNAESFDYFEEFFLAGIPASQQKLVNFLVANNTKNLRNPDAQYQTGMPLSFFVNTLEDTKNYWLLLYEDKEGVLYDKNGAPYKYKDYCSADETDAATERVIVHYGVNLYDAATMQIALAIFPAFRPGMDAAKDQTLRLLNGFSIPNTYMPKNRNTLGASSSIRGWTLTEQIVPGEKIPGIKGRPPIHIPIPETERFYYGKNKTAIFPNGDNKNPGAFYFRGISDQFDLEDPLKKLVDPKGDVKNTWLDWKPITGENAWACLIGPLQCAFSEYAGMPPVTCDEVQLALKIIPAYMAMRADNGGIFYAPWNTAGNIANSIADPFSISNENNFSSFAGLTMLQQILEANGDTTYLPDVNKLLEGIESYFKSALYDEANKVFFTGGTYSDGTDSNPPNYTSVFTPGGPNFQFAVDVHTWGCTVLGVEKVDTWFGEGAAFGLWQTVKSKAGYYTNNVLQGVGYTDVDTDPSIPKDKPKHEFIISAEWSFGAVNMCLVLAEQYGDVNSPFYNQTYAESLRADAQSMMEGVKTLMLDTESRDNNTEAYLYTNRRYFIPFGWWGNPIDSLCSTAWAVMCANRFNPFQLGGDYSGQIISRNHGASVKKKEHKPVLRLENVLLQLADIK